MFLGVKKSQNKKQKPLCLCYNVFCCKVLNFASDAMQRTEIYQNDKVQQQNHFFTSFC